MIEKMENIMSPNGQVGRYDAKTDTFLKPGEKGFTGSKKKSHRRLNAFSITRRITKI